MRLELAYIAAFLDCDGTVVIVRAARGGNEGYRYYGKLCMYSQNLAVLEDIRETIGGEVTPLHRTSLVHVLQLSPTATVAALKLLHPYLRIKREQALVVIALHEQIDKTPKTSYRDGKPGRSRLPEVVYEQRHELYLKVRTLNRKDSEAFRTNRDKSANPFSRKATPSQAAVGQGAAEGVTTREVTPKNPLQETPARKGRHSLSSAEPTTLLQ